MEATSPECLSYFPHGPCPHAIAVVAHKCSHCCSSSLAHVMPAQTFQARESFGPCSQPSPRKSGASSSPGHPFPPTGLPRVSTRFTSLTS
ncbi:hypothetical protein TIFTF001_028747 [Ficus carica]|uniref:Uncharacterized protein n=1 Tax=Ficus carica TaxID=3494 RepID=A0AA88J1Y1_FICCA|nr:hypothetical protein TIFTF001_028747 [Ficus carica]